jgi:hypothetical protein
MSDYNQFKTKVSALIDEHLSKHRPIPEEIEDRIKLIPGRTETNMLGEVTFQKENALISAINVYHNQIQGLIHTRDMILQRTTFGWFILTKSNLLSTVDQKIKSLDNTWKFILNMISMYINESILTHNNFNFENLVIIREELKNRTDRI